MISPINPQLDTNTRRFHLKLMLLQSGLYLIVGLFTITTIQLVLSGDSSRQNEEGREALRRLTMPPSTQIK